MFSGKAEGHWSMVLPKRHCTHSEWRHGLRQALNEHFLRFRVSCSCDCQVITRASDSPAAVVSPTCRRVAAPLRHHALRYHSRAHGRARRSARCVHQRRRRRVTGLARRSSSRRARDTSHRLRPPWAGAFRTCSRSPRCAPDLPGARYPAHIVEGGQPIRAGVAFGRSFSRPHVCSPLPGQSQRNALRGTQP